MHGINAIIVKEILATVESHKSSEKEEQAGYGSLVLMAKSEQVDLTREKSQQQKYVCNFYTV